MAVEQRERIQRALLWRSMDLLEPKQLQEMSDAGLHAWRRKVRTHAGELHKELLALALATPHAREERIRQITPEVAEPFREPNPQKRLFKDYLALVTHAGEIQDELSRRQQGAQPARRTST